MDSRKLARSAAAAVLAGIFTAQTGCASIQIKPVTYQDRETQGLRFYQARPYLLITLDQTKGCAAQVIYLPDFSRGYAVTTSAGLGSVSFKPTLQNGWMLAGFDSKVQSETAQNLSALTGALAEAAKFGTLREFVSPPSNIGGQQAGKEAMGPGLYRFNYCSNGELRGEEPVTALLHVTDAQGQPVGCPAVAGGSQKKPGSGKN